MMNNQLVSSGRETSEDTVNLRLRTFDTVRARNFDEAAQAILSLTLSSPSFFDISKFSWQPNEPGIMKYLSGKDVASVMVTLLTELEKRATLKELAIYGHSSLYYLLQLYWPKALEIDSLSPEDGYVGTLLGHHFFAHPMIREDAIVVGGLMTGNLPAAIVGAAQKQFEPLILQR